ncbi:MAG: hypothetical protein DMG65_09235 [Candidatus Angelobacter sp. Gp1-AA117]|nr:MAG: hypothetical protein DMG65_09235 [Candidatus Angelobacter sp. Gp1-AA117]
MEQSEIVAAYLNEPQEKLLGRWYEETYRQTFGIAPAQATGVAADMKKSFDGWLHKISHLLCVDWKYCEKKKNIGQKAKFVASVSDFIASLTGLPTHGAISVAVLLVEYGYDATCHCSD